MGPLVLVVSLIAVEVTVVGVGVAEVAVITLRVVVVSVQAEEIRSGAVRPLSAFIVRVRACKKSKI